MKLLLFFVGKIKIVILVEFSMCVFPNVTSQCWLEASILMIWAVVYIIRRMTKSEDAETPTAERNGDLFQRRVEMGWFNMVELPLGRGGWWFLVLLSDMLIVVMEYILHTWTDGGWTDDNFWNSCDLEVDGSERNGSLWKGRHRKEGALQQSHWRGQVERCNQK